MKKKVGLLVILSKEQYDYLIKIIVVGDGGVGKTALSVRFAEGKFRDDYKVTIGVDFSIKMLNVYGRRVKLQIWDTGGQEQFSYIRPLYYTGSLGGLVVFDKTNRQSYENIERWFQEVYKNRGKIPLVIIGNKHDLPEHKVSPEETAYLAKNYNTIYFDTSAKTGKSVDLVFKSLVGMILDPKLTEDLDQQKEPIVIYDGSLEKYNTYANEACAFFQAGNKLEALFSLEKAFHWAKVSEFAEGISWCQDQISYLTELINLDKPVEIGNIILICQNCNKFFQVKKDGIYTCPSCYSVLTKI